MRNNILRRILLLSTFALTIVSCEENNSDSIITRFEKFPVVSETTPIEVAELVGGTFTFDFSMDERQITDMHVTVGIGSSSTATEGEDFELSVHEIDIPALGGQDGFSVDVTVLDDLDAVESDETVYLTFSTETPSGIEVTEVKVLTIKACTVPELDLFVGDYSLTVTDGAFGVPVFDDQIVTLTLEGSGTRSFSAIYYEALGIGNAAGDWILKFDGCNGSNLFRWEAVGSGLGCSPSFSIELVPVAPFGTIDLTDDSQFTVVLSETEEDPTDPSACGVDGTLPVTLTFTKI